MISDRFSGQHTGVDGEALTTYQLAVRSFLAHRPFLPELQQALSRDPNLVAGHALSGIAHALIGRQTGMTVSRALFAVTQAALVRVGGGTLHERALASAHAAAAAGRFDEAARLLELHLVLHPTDLLALKLAHALRFMSGNIDSMLRVTGSVMPHWSSRMPGYGFVLGCRAFSLEEGGQWRDADECGRLAVAHEPDDVWALHAVAHVMEMSGRTREGRGWLEPARARWGACGGFGQHLLWHLALFHLSEGDADRALALFDEGMTPIRDGDFRDVANAVSLLWRLEQEGVDVGPRWQTVLEIARERRADCTYAFGSLHYLLALIAGRDWAGADETIAAMRARARSRCDDQAIIMSGVAVALAEALLDGARRGGARQGLERIARQLPMIGGSHAQRDVFLRTLMTAAADSGDGRALAALASIRSEQRREDRFQALVETRVGMLRRRHHSIVTDQLREVAI